MPDEVKADFVELEGDGRVLLTQLSVQYLSGLTLVCPTNTPTSHWQVFTDWLCQTDSCYDMETSYGYALRLNTMRYKWTMHQSPSGELFLIPTAKKI